MSIWGTPYRYGKRYAKRGIMRTITQALPRPLRGIARYALQPFMRPEILSALDVLLAPAIMIGGGFMAADIIIRPILERQRRELILQKQAEYEEYRRNFQRLVEENKLAEASSWRQKYVAQLGGEP
jgi:hypothetical protein